MQVVFGNGQSLTETGPNVYFANLTISAPDGVVLNCKISDGTYEGYGP